MTSFNYVFNEKNIKARYTVRLGQEFWDEITEIKDKRGVNTNRFLGTLIAIGLEKYKEDLKKNDQYELL